MPKKSSQGGREDSIDICDSGTQIPAGVLTVEVCGSELVWPASLIEVSLFSESSSPRLRLPGDLGLRTTSSAAFTAFKIYVQQEREKGRKRVIHPENLSCAKKAGKTIGV